MLEEMKPYIEKLKSTDTILWSEILDSIKNIIKIYEKETEKNENIK